MSKKCAKKSKERKITNDEVSAKKLGLDSKIIVLGEIGEENSGEAEKRRISAITPGVRDQNRCNIFIDGKFAFSLTIAQVVENGLKVGLKIATEQEAELIRQSDFGKLYQRTLEWLLTKPRSIKETRDYLERKRRTRELGQKQAMRSSEKDEPEQTYQFEKLDSPKRCFSKPKTKAKLKTGTVFTTEIAEAVIEKLIERGYLDDERFANFFVENRDRRKGTSQKKLRLELIKKGVNEEIINKALSENPRDEMAEIKKIIARKGEKLSEIKLYQYLLRRGFDLEQVRAALAEKD